MDQTLVHAVHHEVLQQTVVGDQVRARGHHQEELQTEVLQAGRIVTG